MRGILLPIIIAVVWAIIQAAASARAKKQREERLRQQARAQTPGSPAPAPHAPVSVTTQPGLRPPPTHSQVPVAASSRLDELAARRKAQLEHLRQRQQQQQRHATAHVKTTPMRPTPVAMRPAPPTAQRPATKKPTGPRIEEVQASREGVFASGESARQRREAELQVHVEAATRAFERAEVAETAAKKRATAAAARATAAEGAERAARSKLLQDANVAARAIAALKNPASLRDVIVLKEVFDPPLSMRP